MYKGILLLLLAEFTFALSTVFGKMVTSNSAIGGIEITFVRFAIGTLVAGLYMVFTHKSFRPNNLRHVVLRAVFNVTAVMLFFAGLERTTVTNANMLNMTYPAFVFLVAPFINGEKTRLRNIFYLLVTLAGVYLIVAPDFESINPGDLLALLSGLVAGFGIPFLREARKFDSSEVIVFYLMLFGCLMSGVFLLEDCVLPRGIVTVHLLLSGVAAAAGQVFITIGYRYIEAATGSLVSASRIIFAGALGVLIFADPFTVSIMTGALLILVSLFGVGGLWERVGSIFVSR
jgi:drug/metabolite transporter (DMT)-like permease